MAKWKENKTLVLDNPRYKFYWWPSEGELELHDTTTHSKRFEIFRDPKAPLDKVLTRAQNWLKEVEEGTFNWMV